MADLAPLAAFGRTEARRRRFGTLVLAENVNLGLASFALRRDAAAPELRGLMLPAPGAWAEGTGIAAFWMAPGQWMIELKDGADVNFDHDLKAAVPDAAVTAQTDGWVVLEITTEAGPRSLDRILEKLINLDQSRFGPGSATRTLVEHMSVFVIRRRPNAVAVLGMRSAAGSLWHTLETALTRAAEGFQ